MSLDAVWLMSFVSLYLANISARGIRKKVDGRIP
jgi:hypothetical protein